MLNNILNDKRGIDMVGSLFVKIVIGILVLLFVGILYGYLSGDLGSIASSLGNKFRFG